MLHPSSTVRANHSQSLKSHSQKKSTKRWSLQSRQQTLLSDWGDVYEGLDSLHFSHRGSLVLHMDFSGSSSDHVTSRESRLPVVAGETKKITVPPGKVMGMFLGKKDYRFQILKLNSSLHDVVNLFLCIENGAKLPVSFTETKINRPRIMSESRMAMTISENLGKQFDVKTQGLTFSTGSVNSKLCYKMSVCELSSMEKIFAIFCNGNL